VRRGGILNAALAGALARLGHTDTVVIADCGLPIGRGPEVVDLAFQFGIPSFAQVLDGVMAEIVVEGATVAQEVDAANPAVASRFPDAKRVSHEELKALANAATLVIRTGEASPYANVVLCCGVPF
jgi:D-ribose pyranase